DQPAAASALDSLRPHWSAKGRTLEPSVPMALYAKPYSIRGILGKNGERWVPIHALLPLSRVAEAVERVQRFFAERQASLDAHGITHSYITVCAGPEFVLEPMFYWFDEVGPLHAKVLGDKYEKFKHIPANPAARATVARTRAELAELFRELGAVHSQLGKFYRFADNIQPGTYRTLTAIKDALDPGRNLNPGNLGWR
ncbi:MAG: FAD-binding oxidoreductase, partial [Rhodospirillaceae bacterium]|nr:FAD-binding oxidoreductase [Rhodospirillaceae bacterium]